MRIEPESRYAPYAENLHWEPVQMGLLHAARNAQITISGEGRRKGMNEKRAKTLGIIGLILSLSGLVATIIIGNDPPRMAFGMKGLMRIICMSCVAFGGLMMVHKPEDKKESP
jgi:hypothetical protein